MKDIIVIEETKKFRPHPALREGVNCIDTKYCKYEKVPTNWEELKEMCKIEDMSECDDEVKIPWHNNTHLFFYEKDGEIVCKDKDSCIEMIIGYDRTPEQMYGIIKNLIGEE